MINFKLSNNNVFKQTLAENQLAKNLTLSYQDDLVNPNPHDWQRMFSTGLERISGIFEEDTRERVNDTLMFPFSGVARIITYWSNGEISIASGAMVSPYHLLTAGHTLYDKNEGGYAQRVEVVLGSKGTIIDYNRTNFEYYGVANSVNLRVDNLWANGENFDYDWGLITLDRNIGNYTGWFNYDVNNTNITNGTQVNIAGYPSDFFDSDNNGIWDNYDMTYQVGEISQTTELTLRSRDLDIESGSSGSPVWINEGNEKVIYGVVSNTTYRPPVGPSMYNEFTRITENRANILTTWINQDNGSLQPIDKPDWVDYDQWFETNLASISSTQINPGNPFSVTATIRNNGTASSSTPILVSFYASTDNFITTNDYKIGDVMVWTIAPFSSQSVTWTGIFPTIVSGSYKVGWIIDSDNRTQEFDELNNTGIIENLNVTVSSTPQNTDPLLQTPVYRFYNMVAGGHFFTTSLNERDIVLNTLPQFRYEGIGFKASAVGGGNLVPAYRFYNTIAGGHFYTISAAERDSVINTLPQYRYEGIGFYTYGANSNLGQDSYRFYNTVAGGHFFTINPAERDMVINTLPQYVYEGVAFEAGL